VRVVVVGILALCCGGCATAPAFDLVSRDPGSPWLVGQRWVRTESSRATVNASFDRIWLDHLIFEVEVVNQSDAPLLVDPGQFSFTLASSAGDMPRSLGRRFSAEDPARVHARLDREASGAKGIGGAVLGLASVVAVVALSVTLSDIDPAPSEEVSLDDAPRDRYQQAVAYERAQSAELRRSCERAARELLARTELAPGQSLRGEVWLPAWPVRRVTEPEASGENPSITAGPARARSDHGLTLRTPDALGGQEIEYSVCATD